MNILLLTDVLELAPYEPDSDMIVCGTGHRPQKLPGTFSPQTFERLVTVAFRFLCRLRPAGVIVGMALGWDQALAVAAMSLGIPVHAFIPFVGQADAWPVKSMVFYNKLLQRCASTKVISFGEYRDSMMQKRNEVMVQNSELVVALWDGSDGGTANCIRYAEKQGREIVNLWGDFIDHA